MISLSNDISGRPHYSLNRQHHAIKNIGFARQLLAALHREAIEAGLPVVLGDAPFRREPALYQHAIQGRIQRPVFDVQAVLGGVLYALRYGVAVERTAAQGAENQQVERAGQQLRIGGRFLSHVRTIYSPDRGVKRLQYSMLAEEEGFEPPNESPR